MPPPLLLEPSSYNLGTIVADKEAIRKKIEAFVTAYNDINKELAAQTKYDAATKTAGALQGDSAAVSLRASLRNTLRGNSAASTTFTRLAEIGRASCRERVL